MEKTNVMRFLDAHKIEYRAREYDPALTDGQSVARTLGLEADRVFKTLVTTDGKRNYFVFVIPVNCTLHLKKAAAAVGAKSVEMIKQRDLLPTVVNDTAQLFDAIVFSAGKVGFQVELPPDALLSLVNGKYADVVAE